MLCPFNDEGDCRVRVMPSTVCVGAFNGIITGWSDECPRYLAEMQWRQRCIESLSQASREEYRRLIYD